MNYKNSSFDFENEIEIYPQRGSLPCFDEGCTDDEDAWESDGDAKGGPCCCC